MGVFLGVISGLIQLGSAMFFIYTVQMKAGIMRVILRLRHKISPHSRCTVRAGADRVGYLDHPESPVLMLFLAYYFLFCCLFLCVALPFYSIAVLLYIVSA